MPQTRHYEMKDSGVEWIGKMPRHWRIERAKFHFRQSFERGNSIPELLAATQKHGMYPQRLLEGVVQVMAGTDLQQFKSVHINDFVISLRSFQGGFERSDYEGVCSPAYQVFHADKQYDVKWLKWFFKNDMFIDAMNALTVGIREGRNIKFDDFANSLLPVPPLSEQTAIAAYLDEKCATIDAIIVEAKSSIEGYKSWKASVIFEAVTKGLNPNAEMKDSGVEWIGEIPKGWKVKAAKYCVEIHHGSDPVTEGDVPVYGSGADSFKTCGEYKEGPAVLVGRKGATLHIPHYIIGRYWNVDTAFDVKAHPDFSLKFYYYLAICFDYKFYISQTTLPGMTQTNYRNMPIPVPPLSEQASIVSYLDRKCSLIDGIILEKEELIKELEHYKRSLIFEAVTGKRRVC